MKKRIFLVLFILLISISTVTTAFARGGGGGGGSGGGGGGGGGSSSSSGSSGYGDNRNSDPYSLFIMLGFIYFLRKKNDIVCVVYSTLNSFSAIKVLKSVRKNCPYYSREQLDNSVEDAYFKLQEAWTKRDILICSDCLSTELCKTYDSKLQWMIIRHERNILKRIKLLNYKPVSVRHFKQNSLDTVWYYIKGRMVDYTYNESENTITDGSRFSKSFIEFWLFTRENNKWVLTEIKQTDEFDFSICESFSEDNNNQIASM